MNIKEKIMALLKRSLNISPPVKLDIVMLAPLMLTPEDEKLNLSAKPFHIGCLMFSGFWGLLIAWMLWPADTDDLFDYGLVSLAGFYVIATLGMGLWKAFSHCVVYFDKQQLRFIQKNPFKHTQWQLPYGDFQGVLLYEEVHKTRGMIGNNRSSPSSAWNHYHIICLLHTEVEKSLPLYIDRHLSWESVEDSEIHNAPLREWRNLASRFNLPALRPIDLKKAR